MSWTAEELSSYARSTDPAHLRECGRVQRPDERGWRSYLTTDEEEPAEALVYCPDCAADEFDPDDPTQTAR